MGEAANTAPDSREMELQWLRSQVSSHSAFTSDQRRFILQELKVNPVGSGFAADLRHVLNSPYRSHINRVLKDLPPYRGRKLLRIHKAKEGEYLLFEWEAGPPHVHGDSSFHVKVDDDYQDLIQRIRSEDVARVTLIQHWGQSTESLRNYLLDRTQAEIELYIQNPEHACCLEQKEKIKRYIDDFLRGATYSPKKDVLNARVKVFLYDTRATVRAVLIDDKILTLGWYVYYARREPGREIDILGRTLPSIYAQSDWSGFSELRRIIDFWVDNAKKVRHQIFPPTASGDSDPVQIAKVKKAPELPDSSRPEREHAERAHGKTAPEPGEDSSAARVKGRSANKQSPLPHTLGKKRHRNRRK